jgi:hypothetical protein
MADIVGFNKLCDKFFKTLYDLDVYITPNKFTHIYTNPYIFNVLFFPDKYLKQGGDYSSGYRNILENNKEFYQIIDEFWSYFSIDNQIKGVFYNEIDFDFISCKVSSDVGDYLKGYTKQVIELMEMYVDTDYFILSQPEMFRDDNWTATNFELEEYGFYIFQPRHDLTLRKSDFFIRFTYDGNVDDSEFEHFGKISEELKDYLSNNMEYNPEIHLRFEKN